MSMHLEFAVLGPPISNQQNRARGKANLAAWRATVAGEARKQWTKPLIVGELKAIIINFHQGNKPSLDVDNLSKPVLDAMQQIVYDDDRQIRQAEISHQKMGALYSIAGVSKLLVNMLQSEQQFVYVRLEDPVIPFPLPR